MDYHQADIELVIDKSKKIKRLVYVLSISLVAIGIGIILVFIAI